MLYKKHIFILLFLLISSCQQCILDHQADPKLGFEPQSKALNSDEYFSLDIVINEIESPFFGMTFQLEFDSSKIDLICTSQGIENSFFGQNYLAEFINPDGNKIHSSISLLNGQDPISGSGNVAICNGYTKSSGTAHIDFIPNSFYFINEFGDELLNPINTDSSYKAMYNLTDSVSIIYDFHLLNARIDIDHPGIIDN